MTTDGERGLLSIAFDPDYAHNKLFYVYYTNSDGNIEVDRVPRQVQLPGPGRVAPAGDRDPAPDLRQPQRRHARVRPRRRPLPGDGRRRLRRRPARERAEPPRPARQAAADRPPRCMASSVQRPEEQSLRRQARPRRDLRARPAQPVPVLLRQGAHRDRRRRPGQLGGGRLREAARRFAARTSAGTTSRAAPLHFPGDNDAPRPKHRYRPPILEYAHNSRTAGRRLRDHRRRGGPRSRRSAPCAGATSTPTSARATLRSLAPHRPRARHDHALGLHVDNPSSFSVGATPTTST